MLEYSHYQVRWVDFLSLTLFRKTKIDGLKLSLNMNIDNSSFLRWNCIILTVCTVEGCIVPSVSLSLLHDLHLLWFRIVDTMETEQ